MTDIDALLLRMEDPSETFTVAEVQSLIDWTTERVSTSQYQSARVATIMQESVETKALVHGAMQQLLDLWDTTPMTPELMEVSHGQAQA